jgi:subtilisin family serine protease
MQKVSPNLVAAVEAAAGDNDGAFIVEFDEQPDLTPAYQMDWESRGWWVYNTLDAARAQRQEALKAVGLTGVCFMSTPVCQVGGGMSEVEVAAKMKQVSYVRAPEIFQVDPVTQEEAKQEIQAVEWGIAKIRADQVWSLEVNGTDVVVANIDTGVDYTHPALVGNYRGTITGSHDYSWYDPANICPNPQVPCDNNSHGTHTMGTIAGGLGIGVAPGATWIAAKGCESSGCSEFALNSAADWILAPRKTDGSNPNPSMRPQLVSNSWGGGRGDTWYASKVDAWLAAGIIPVFSAGNSGPACETANDPGEYPNVISAGATDSADGIAFFSSRGPRSSGGIGPDLSAPGVGVRSSVPGGGYSEYSGTSMAAPHVAGAIALVLSANPGLMGNFEAMGRFLFVLKFLQP